MATIRQQDTESVSGCLTLSHDEQDSDENETEDTRAYTAQLSDKQLLALPYLVTAHTMSDAAHLANFSQATLYRWMEDEDFRNELKRRRDEASELASAELKGLMLKATWVLAQGLESRNESVRLRAAQIALAACSRTTETRELERRVDLIEDVIPIWAHKHSKR